MNLGNKVIVTLRCIHVLALHKLYNLKVHPWLYYNTLWTLLMLDSARTLEPLN